MLFLSLWISLNIILTKKVFNCPVVSRLLSGNEISLVKG